MKKIVRSLIVSLIVSLVVLLAACSQASLPLPPEETSNEESIDNVEINPLDFGTPDSDAGISVAVGKNSLYVVGDTHGNLDGENFGKGDGFIRRYNGGKLWGKQFGTSENEDLKGVAIDNRNNAYVIGNTEGALGFKVGKRDSFLRKYSPRGELLWTRQFGTKGNDTVYDVVINSSNQVYVLGSGSRTSRFTIRKFNASGKLLKTKNVYKSGTGNTFPQALTVDTLDNVIVLFDSTGYVTSIHKYNKDLQLIWEEGYVLSENSELSNDIATDSENSIYFTFDEYQGVLPNSVHVGGGYVKVDSAGKFISQTSVNDAFIPSSITIDNNEIYIAGREDTSVSWSNSEDRGWDIAVFKYGSDGTRLWSKRFSKVSGYGSAEDDYATSIAVSDAVYITGWTFGSLFQNENANHGGSDAYLAQLSKDRGIIMGVDQ